MWPNYIKFKRLWKILRILRARLLVAKFYKEFCKQDCLWPNFIKFKRLWKILRILRVRLLACGHVAYTLNYVGIFNELVDLLVIAGFGIFREQSDCSRGLLEF